MAAVLGDLLLSGQVDIGGLDVEIIPGIPAHCAAASLLGSPLACDFAVISLSDHLVEKERILARVEACAASDLVIVLYNPASSLRRRILSEAAESILKYRPPDVPVALVRNAWREGESVCITTLGELGETEADMHTLVLVGNSETGLAGNWMATRRGYGRREGVERSEVVL
jgi:precorrin-3B C17-methyltransferase